jgi:hypothetical protein
VNAVNAVNAGNAGAHPGGPLSDGPWKANWTESRAHYLDWWARRGLVVSMWEHLRTDGPPHEAVPAPAPARDLDQRWFDPEWRAAELHHTLAGSSLLADILPVANTQLGPGSLAAALGASLQAGEDTIWIHPRAADAPVVLDEANPWLRLHLDLVAACRRLAGRRYFVGCPDLVEGLDTLAGLRGTTTVLEQMVDEPDELLADLQAVNDAWFDVFERIYEVINLDGEMAFCYFSLWAPGRMAKLQSDISTMISPAHFRRFVVPFIAEQSRRLDFSLYHLDGVGAMRHLDAILEIEGLDAVQWTPGAGEPQGGDPRWFDLYRRIRAAGKSIMACWVELDELAPLLDAVGPSGTSVLVHATTERDIEAALVIADRYR